jgi:hypothetical protein
MFASSTPLPFDTRAALLRTVAAHADPCTPRIAASLRSVTPSTDREALATPAATAAPSTRRGPEDLLLLIAPRGYERASAALGSIGDALARLAEHAAAALGSSHPVHAYVATTYVVAWLAAARGPLALDLALVPDGLRTRAAAADVARLDRRPAHTPSLRPIHEPVRALRVSPGRLLIDAGLSFSIEHATSLAPRRIDVEWLAPDGRGFLRRGVESARIAP